jgi:hypothetical protein
MFGGCKPTLECSQTPVDNMPRQIDGRHLWLSFFWHQKIRPWGDGMKKLVVALALVASIGPVSGGGLTEPAMDTAVVAEETGSSGGDNWVGIMMLVLVVAAAVSD